MILFFIWNVLQDFHMCISVPLIRRSLQEISDTLKLNIEFYQNLLSFTPWKSEVFRTQILTWFFLRDILRNYVDNQEMSSLLFWWNKFKKGLVTISLFYVVMKTSPVSISYWADMPELMNIVFYLACMSFLIDKYFFGKNS